MYLTSKASSSEIPRQKCKKYQYEERYKPLKFHIYIEMIGKYNVQMAHNP